MSAETFDIARRRRQREAEQAVLAAVGRWHRAQQAVREAKTIGLHTEEPEADQWLARFHARSDALAAAEQELALAYRRWREASKAVSA